MSGTLSLWLPVLVTAVLIFIASSLIHMVFKWHNSDYKKLGNEDDVRAAIRASSPVPGQYVVPHCMDMKDMQGEEMMKKFTEGPIALITVRKNGPPAMGGTLALWFIFNLVIATIAACVACQVYGLSSDAREAGRLVGILSFLAYAAGSVPLGIWMGKPWGSVAKDVLDGAIYGVISGCTFMWLWP